jgi:hypothetical protein
MSTNADLAAIIGKATRKGTALRFARGVVVSSTIGQTVLTLDGGTTQSTAFNFDHTQLIPTGTVVDVVCVGVKHYVIGSYGTPVIGQVVSNKVGPASTTSFASGITTAFTLAVPLVANQGYAVTLTLMQGQQITGASASATQVWVSDSSALIPGSGFVKAFISASLALNAFASGSQTRTIWPTSTATDTFTVHVETGANSLSIAASDLELIVTRIF